MPCYQITHMKILIFVLFILISESVCAANLTVETTVIRISGVLNNLDYERTAQLIDKNKQIDTVVFDNCMGGIVSIGYKISQLIQKAHLNTVAKNQVHSSCAYAYLAGTKRHFSFESGTHIMLLHVGRAIEGQPDVTATVNPALMRYLSYLTDNKLTPVIKSYIERSTLPTQGIFFITTNYLFYRVHKTVYCDGSESGDTNKCLVLSDADPLVLGIVTSK